MKKEKKMTSKKTTEKKSEKAVKKPAKVFDVKKVIKKEYNKLPKKALTKFESNPIISPVSENAWETWQVFNPSAILLNDRVHFIYRAIGHDCISRFGYASSPDGFIVDDRLSYPVFEHYIKNRESIFNYYSFVSGGSFAGAEDAVLVRVNDEDKIYMFYIGCDNNQLRIALTSINIKDFLNKKWEWKKSVYISPPSNGAIHHSSGHFYKNWMLFPEKINNKYAILHCLVPNILIDYFDDMDFDGNKFIYSNHPLISQDKSNYTWEDAIRGPAAPPVKTKYGWLLFYHALQKNEPWKYKAGAMLLDLKDPTKILYRAREPVLESEELYEKNGCNPNIIYVRGVVIKNGTLLVYYGAADTHVCVAYANLDKFLNDLISDKKPKLKRKVVKKK